MIDDEIIGASFDSTVLTRRNAYGYDPAVNRSVLVTAAAVTAALRHAYGMGCWRSLGQMVAERHEPCSG